MPHRTSYQMVFFYLGMGRFDNLGKCYIFFETKMIFRTFFSQASFVIIKCKPARTQKSLYPNIFIYLLKYQEIQTSGAHVSIETCHLLYIKN